MPKANLRDLLAGRALGALASGRAAMRALAPLLHTLLCGDVCPPRMQSAVTHGLEQIAQYDDVRLARESYAIADAMLAVRKESRVRKAVRR